jgi:septum site-determining protein MinD
VGKIIVVASGKGGTGKTTAAAAISSCLAVLEHKTLCIDFDTELRNLDLALCMADFTVMDVLDVLSGRVNLMSACSESPQIPNLFFLSAPAVSMPDSIGKAEVVTLFAEIRKNFDYCIIDAPAGIGKGFRLAYGDGDADMSIIIATGDMPSIRDATRVANAIREMGIPDIRLVINRVQQKNYRRIKTTVDDVIDTIGVQLLGLVAEDRNIFLALHANTPLVLYKKRHSAYDFLDIARRITGDDIPLKQYKRI